MSFGTDINLGLRYVLPIFPYVFISAGKLAPWAAGLAGRAGGGRRSAVDRGRPGGDGGRDGLDPPALPGLLQRVSGGPGARVGAPDRQQPRLGPGPRRPPGWGRPHGDERIGLAYFGQINPSLFDLRGDGFDWFLPPAQPGSGGRGPAQPRGRIPPPRRRGSMRSAPRSSGASPGGSTTGPRGAPFDARRGAFAYFAELRPIARVGHSILIYRIDEADADRLAAQLDRGRTLIIRKSGVGPWQAGRGLLPCRALDSGGGRDSRTSRSPPSVAPRRSRAEAARLDDDHDRARR